MSENNNQKLAFAILQTKPVAYNPDLAKCLKSVPAALLLSQLLYWSDKGKDPVWFYKTIDEIFDETGLTRDQQDLAIKKLKAAQCIEVKLIGVPAKRHFKLNITEILMNLQTYYSTKIQIEDNPQTRLREIHNLDSGKATNSIEENPQTITDNTQEITQKNTSDTNTALSSANKKEGKFSSIKDITPDVIREIAFEYKVPEGLVQMQFEKMKNWLEAKGRKYKNYKAALRNWSLKEAQAYLERQQRNQGNRRSADASNL